MDINQKTDVLVVIANILLVLSALPTLLLALETSRGGPEGPVGFHLVTAPLALLQVLALAIAIHRGVWDFAPVGRPVLYFLLLPYLIGMTVLPFFGLNRDFTGPLSKVGMVVVVVACFAAVNRFPFPGLAVSGLVLSMGSVGGLAVVGGLLKEEIANSIRVAAADADRMDSFQISQAAFDAGEWAKLPEQPELWQLIQFTHSFNKDVQKQCLEKIAALPDLEQKMIALLGTGWADHSLRYLNEYYPLRYGPLANVFAGFLDKELAKWKPQLTNNPGAGNFAINLYRHFDVAEKIMKDGGDLRAPLERWVTFLGKLKGMGMLTHRVKGILK